MKKTDNLDKLTDITWKNAAKILSAQQDFRKENGREATDDELIKILGISADKFQKAKAILEIPADEQHEKIDINTIDTSAKDPFVSASQKNLRQIITSALCELDPKEETIIRLKYGIGSDRNRSLEEIGELLGVTRERIREIEQRALAKLKHPARVKKLQCFVADEDDKD